ncbi:MAG TPA: hypothetical protein VI934_01290 [Candidatus Nanoarchaeia archaeon]|nr:hypothetical protein [Candidatus Nanoarchaeia archaeon]
MSFDGIMLYKPDFTGDTDLRERVIRMMEGMSPTIADFAAEINKPYTLLGRMYPAIDWKERAPEGSVVRSIVAHPARDADGKLGIILTGQAIRTPSQSMVVLSYNTPSYKTLPDVNSVWTALRECYSTLASVRPENIVEELESAHMQ